MRLREQPETLRRGAAPPTERTSFFCVGVSSALHAALLLFFVSWVKPPLEVALPGGGQPSGPREQLVKLSPLRTFPAPEATPPAPEKAPPRPALVKRYTPGAKIVPRPERGPMTKKTSDESRSSSREVATTAASDRAQRWWSPDSSASVGVRADGDFRWAYYLASIRNKIGSRWVPPPGLGGRTAHATIYFRIGRDGSISVARIEDGSGMTFFDQTAMRALQLATPLPPLPAGYDGDWLGVHFGFEYQQ
jgi:TonB family protein